MLYCICLLADLHAFVSVCSNILSERPYVPYLCNKNFLYVHFGFIPLPFMLLCPQKEDEMQTKLVLWMIIFCMWCSGFLTTWNLMIAFPSLSGLWLSKACLDPRKTLSSTHGCLVSSIDQPKIKKKKKKIIMIYSSLFIFMSANVVLTLRSVIQETV